jgi:hypothetical protein
MIARPEETRHAEDPPYCHLRERSRQDGQGRSIDEGAELERQHIKEKLGHA